MISVKNQQNRPVDWWFIYKTPRHTGREQNQGFDFLYFDPDSDALSLSPVGMDRQEQALGHTLAAIFNAPETGGYIVYNDEHADTDANNSEKGHCKGILAFDKASDTAVFLLHSTPRFPASMEAALPAEEEIYGQTFICITLPDYATANRIAGQMLAQQNPQILTESSRIPASLGADEPLSKLFHGVDIDESPTPSTLNFHSKAGKAFMLVAKSRHWGEDFWLDLVSPELKADLIVESWRRGAVTPLQDGRSAEFDEDTLAIDFKLPPGVNYQWPYTKDHAKWAIALENDTSALPWVCVADLNRMVSQEKRGGASLCFQEPKLWQALKAAEEKLHTISRATPAAETGGTSTLN